MPVERSSTSIHCSSVKARRPSNSSSRSMFGIWIGFRSRSEERRALLVLLVEVFQRDDAPDAADQQLLELLDDGCW